MSTSESVLSAVAGATTLNVSPGAKVMADCVEKDPTVPDAANVTVATETPFFWMSNTALAVAAIAALA